MTAKAPRAAPILPASGARILRVHEVFGTGSFTGMSRSAGYRAMLDGTFPPGFLLNAGTRAWLLEDLEAWARRIAKQNACVMPQPQQPQQQASETSRPTKRGRGRPRLHPLPDPAMKRPRGRPRKQPGSIFGGPGAASGGQ